MKYIEVFNDTRQGVRIPGPAQIFLQPGKSTGAIDVSCVDLNRVRNIRGLRIEWINQEHEQKPAPAPIQISTPDQEPVAPAPVPAVSSVPEATPPDDQPTEARFSFSGRRRRGRPSAPKSES